MKTSPAPREGLSVQDRKFLAVAAKANEDQIRLCRFAEKKAKSPAVKDFARKMVADHTAVAGEIAGLEHTRAHEHAKALPHAWRAHVHLAQHAHPRHHPRTAKAGHPPGNDEISKLRGKSGADFDRAFMQLQVDFYARTVEKLDGEAKSAGSEK
jgi:putative membrane protein